MVENQTETTISLRIPQVLLSAFDTKIGKKSRASVIRDLIGEFCKDINVPLVSLDDLENQLVKVTRDEDNLKKLFQSEELDVHYTVYDALGNLAVQFGSDYGLETNVPLVKKRLIAFNVPENTKLKQKHVLLFIHYIELIAERRRLTIEITNIRRSNNN
jgi:hypothetical protein